MMDINLTYDRPEEGPGTGPIQVGWFLTSDKGAVLYDPPERVAFRQTNKTHAKSASRCPGVIQLESRYFMVKCPFDIHIGFGRDDKGKAVLINRAGTTFRKLPDDRKEGLTEAKAIALMLAQPGMIKRPVLEETMLEGQGALMVGFKPEAYAARFG